MCVCVHVLSCSVSVQHLARWGWGPQCILQTTGTQSKNCRWYFPGDFCCLQQSVGQGPLRDICRCFPCLIWESSQGHSLSLFFHSPSKLLTLQEGVQRTVGRNDPDMSGEGAGKENAKVLKNLMQRAVL